MLTLFYVISYDYFVIQPKEMLFEKIKFTVPTYAPFKSSYKNYVGVIGVHVQSQFNEIWKLLKGMSIDHDGGLS